MNLKNVVKKDPNLNRVVDFVLLLQELLELQGFLFVCLVKRSLLGLSNNTSGNDTLIFFEMISKL